VGFSKIPQEPDAKQSHELGHHICSVNRFDVVDRLRLARYGETLLREVVPGLEVRSPSGLPFKVLAVGKHAQDCSLPMVIFTNTTPTHDRPAGEIWVLEESLFLKNFHLAEDGIDV
jgi:hypothetical protein